jgi:5'(3')-deoxyribonucleotidase
LEWVLKKIGYDLDGVLYPWQEVVYENIHLFTKRPLEDYATFWNQQVREFGDTFWNSILEYVPFYTQRGPIEDSLETVLELSKRYDTCYITSRPECIRYATKWWLDYYKFPCTDNLIFSREKQTIIRLEGVDIFVDDRTEYMEKTKNICGAYLVDQDWNKGYIDPRVVRLYNIKELLQYV